MEEVYVQEQKIQDFEFWKQVTEIKIQNLPAEIILQIFDQLSDEAKWNLATTCQYFLVIFRKWVRLDTIPIYFSSNIPYVEGKAPTKLGKFCNFKTPRRPGIVKVYDQDIPSASSGNIVPQIAWLNTGGLPKILHTTFISSFQRNQKKEGGGNSWSQIFDISRSKKNLNDLFITLRATINQEKASLFIGIDSVRLNHYIEKSNKLRALTRSALLTLVYLEAEKLLENGWRTSSKPINQFTPINPIGITIKLHDYQIEAFSWYISLILFSFLINFIYVSIFFLNF